MSANEEMFQAIIDDIESMAVPVPEDLDEAVAQTVTGIHRSPYHIGSMMLRVASMMAAFLLGMSILIYTNEAVASFALNVPGLKIIAEMIHGDSGITNAYEHGYPMIEMVTAEKEGYQLILTNIMIDEERVVFNAMMSGPGFEDKDTLYKDEHVNGERSVDDSADGVEVMDDTSFCEFHISLPDAQSAVSARYIDIEGNGQARKFTVHLSGPESEDYIQRLIEESQPLRLVATVYVTSHESNTNDKLAVFDPIEIPVTSDNVLMSREVEIGQTVATDFGSFEVRSLTVSPTKMSLITSMIPGEDIDRMGLKEVYLVDNKGREYRAEGHISMGFGQGTMTYEFLPSFYFDDEVSEMSLVVEKMYYGYDETYKLGISDDYPKVLDYHGFEILVAGIQHDDEILSIEYRMPDSEGIHIQGFEVAEKHFTEEGRGGIAWSTLSEYAEDDYDLIRYENIRGSESYELMISYPEIYYDTDIELPLVP